MCTVADTYMMCSPTYWRNAKLSLLCVYTIDVCVYTVCHFVCENLRALQIFQKKRDEMNPFVVSLVRGDRAI